MQVVPQFGFYKHVEQQLQKYTTMIYIHEENGFWNRETVLQPSFKIGMCLEDYEIGAYLLFDAKQE